MYEQHPSQLGVGRVGAGPLSGTGRVGDDLWLIAHDDLTGRRQLPRRQLGLGLAGGLLAELLLDGSVFLQHGHVMVPAGKRRRGQAEPVTGRVLGLIASERDLYLVRDWLRLIAQTAAQDIGGRLEQEGFVVHSGRWVRWRQARYVPVDPDRAFAAISRVRAAMRLGRPATVSEVTLAGLVVVSGLAFRVDHDPGVIAAGQAAGMLPPDLQALIIATRAAVDSTVVTSRT